MRMQDHLVRQQDETRKEFMSFAQERVQERIKIRSYHYNKHQLAENLGQENNKAVAEIIQK